MNWVDIFSTVFNQNTLGAIILAGFFTLVGIIAKGLIDKQGNVSVAKINSETTLGAKAMETLTMALEVLQEENRSMKANVKMLESHVDTLIELILRLVKAHGSEAANEAIADLEKFLRSIGRWPR
jgi:phosphate uptake regulator